MVRLVTGPAGLLAAAAGLALMGTLGASAAGALGHRPEGTSYGLVAAAATFAAVV